MKFLSINLVITVFLLLAISLYGCDDSGLNAQTDLHDSKTANFIGVWHPISDDNLTDSEHQLEFKNNILTEIISNSTQVGSCVDDVLEPQLYREYEWSKTQHSDQLKLVTTTHIECGSEISTGNDNERMVSFHLEDDVLLIFNKRWKRSIFEVD